MCLTDVIADGLSMVYSFYDPVLEKNSLGTFMILDHIRIAKEAGLPYVYLGYWVPGSPKMQYKANFSPLEVFYRGAWVDMDDADMFAPVDDTILTQPIPEQVANIRLPDVGPK